MTSTCSERFLSCALALALTACGSRPSPADDGGPSGVDAGRDASMPTAFDAGRDASMPTENDSGPAPGTCGDGVCDASETTAGCPGDCRPADACVDLSDCTACPTGLECGTCCQLVHPDANSELDHIVIQACGCTSGALCESECSDDACLADAPATACIACINGAITARDACIEQSLGQCALSPTCTPVLDCYGTCPM